MNPKIVYKSNKIKNLLAIQPETIKDHRGNNYEAYNESVYNDLFQQKITFPVDSYARSHKNVIRGLHGDFLNWKLIDVLVGTIFCVVIDVKKDSPTYMGMEKMILDDFNRYQIFIPPGCVNGHCIMSNEGLFHYRLSVGFTPQENQISFKWNDPTFSIPWPTKTPILSDRDK